MNEQLYYSVLQNLQLHYQRKLDRYILYKKSRWLVSFLLMALFFARIINVEGFYVVAYILGMYQLQIAIDYLTPLGLPRIGEEEEDDEFNNDFIELPISDKNDSRPLLRTSSEFKVWQNNIISILIGMICTLIPILDVPVFLPFIILYFFMVVIQTFKKYIQHMRKYKYSILDFYKK
ncbi:hypothetical protein pb186bvf_009089 [Paramecium bursaria]